MLRNRVAQHLRVPSRERILVIDPEDFELFFDYKQMLIESGYQVIPYEDVEGFRFEYESNLKEHPVPMVVVAKGDLYIPYDIRKAYLEVDLTLGSIYPRLHSTVLRRHMRDIDLIDCAYATLYEDLSDEKDTEEFIKNSAFSKANVERYLDSANEALIEQVKSASSYRDWFAIGKWNARLEYYAALIDSQRDQTSINDHFQLFVQENYSKLFSEVSQDAPPVLTKILDLITRNRTQKVALVVVDGMSLFDFEVLVRCLKNFDIVETETMAIIPTLTSFSRRSILSGKYPLELEDPFKVAREQRDFYEAMEGLGYTSQQVAYERGCDSTLRPSHRFAAIIVNEIDDLVHRQIQGKKGMLQDVTLWAEQGELQILLNDLIDSGFTVYMTADHGNTLCQGVGQKRGFGVETETKAKRVIILKDFAEVDEDLQQKTFPYEGIHLDLFYKYLFCKGNTSFDIAGRSSMTHGGISIEEVIVPFIRIKELSHG